ncbi:MAG: serine acetyltransferase, partial [Clostridia bacterium]|nr:serine acetyltransferase [Clostridia bacterium]
NRITFKSLSMKLGFSIPAGVFAEGLSIAHYGTIVVSSQASVGKNCRIHEGVNIGATNGSSLAPRIGDNVFIASGAKIIGDVTIADDVCIGANAVVVRSITESGTTWGGVPAKKISDNDSHSNLPRGLFE